MFLERVLAPIFPAWSMRRLMQQRAVREMLAQYDGARVTRRTRNWNPGGAGPITETGDAIHILRNRSRDLVRNNPYASAGLDVLVAYQVGTGIVPRSATGDTTADAAANALWAKWSPFADMAGRLDVFGLQALAARSRAESGEALALLVNLSRAEQRARGTPVPLAIQMLEPDQIYTAMNEDFADGGATRQGVQLDKSGRPVVYHLLQSHPGEMGTMPATSLTGSTRKVPADQVLHVFRQDRPGQVRGVPDLTSVMTRLRMLDEYEDAALEQAKVQACLAAFVTSGAPANKGPLEAADDLGDPRKTFSPGMIERLVPGEDVKFSQPSGAGSFSEFAQHQLRAVAAGFGLTYDLMTGDLAQANYSSLRAGRLAFKRRLESAQWLMLVPRFCQPIWDAFIQSAIVAGELAPREAGYPAMWGPPRFEMVDPLKDTLAIEKQIRLGLSTWGHAVSEQGWDPDRQLAEIEEWNKKLTKAGVILDSDPRYLNEQGAAQDAKQNARVQLTAAGSDAPAPTTGA